MVVYDAAYYRAIRQRIWNAGLVKARTVSVGEEPRSTGLVPEKKIEPIVINTSAPTPILRGLYSASPQVREIIREVCERHNTCYEEIVGGSHKAWLMTPRVEIGVGLRNLGFTTPMIGKIMKRDHSTIVHLLRSKRAEYAREQWIQREQKRTEEQFRRLPHADVGDEGFVEVCAEPASNDAGEALHEVALRMGTGM